jgi:3-hydroxyacyl-[acyl-carrier-protein] dehydratase
VIGIDGIKRMLPHRYPILLLDQVVDVVPGQRLTARKAISGNEPWYERVDSDRAADHAYPPSLFVESWAQAGVLLAVWEQPNPDVLAGKVELAGVIKDVRFGPPVFPGDVLEHRVRLVRSVGDTAILAGETVAGDRTVLTVAHFVVALRDVDVLRPAAAGEQVRHAGT